MADINAQHFIDELRFDIQSKDKIKARIVLSHFDEVDAKTQKMALFELSRAPDTFVIPLIVGLLADTPYAGSSRADLKEILFSKALDYPETLIQLLIREVKPDHKLLLAEVAGE